MPNPFLEKLEILTNAAIISFIAAFIRLIFYRKGTWIQTTVTFFGGIVLGVLVGYSIDGLAGKWDKLIIAAAAITAKEIIEFLINAMPKILGRFVKKKLNNIDDDSNLYN